MRSALCRLSYRAATSAPPDHRELAHQCSLAPSRVALAIRLCDDRQNLRHNFSPPEPAARIELATSRLPIEYSANLSFAGHLIADFGLQIADLMREPIRNLQSTIRNSSCSGRDSNSDRALIRCLQGISLPLCQLSYRSVQSQTSQISNLKSQISNLKSQISNLNLKSESQI